MKYILTRHCETDWNTAGRMQGWTDIPLNEAGQRQAVALADLLRPYHCAIIISSDLLRAKETAAMIASALGIPMRTDARLRECRFGRLEGSTRREIAQNHGPAIQSVLTHYNDYDFTGFGGESRDQVLRRHLALLDEIKRANPDGLPLLVGHGRGLNTLLNHCMPSEHPRLERGGYRVLEY